MTAHTIAEMTQDEFQEMLETIVERTVEHKLMEILGDPDEGLMLRESVQHRVARQQQAVAEGARGVALDDVLDQLGLN
jgi:hypothetical protein